jgi:hypothetical protein
MSTLLSPAKVSATYRYGRGIVIEVSGCESGVENVRIRSAGSMPLEFPMFVVEADETSGVRVAPYEARIDFAVCRVPDAIVMHSLKGSRRYEVRPR